MSIENSYLVGYGVICEDKQIAEKLQEDRFEEEDEYYNFLEKYNIIIEFSSNEMSGKIKGFVISTDKLSTFLDNDEIYLLNLEDFKNNLNDEIENNLVNSAKELGINNPSLSFFGVTSIF